MYKFGFLSENTQLVVFYKYQNFLVKKLFFLVIFSHLVILSPKNALLNYSKMSESN